MLLSTYGTIEFDLNCDTNHYYRIEEFANNCGRVQNVQILSYLKIVEFYPEIRLSKIEINFIPDKIKMEPG